MPLKINSNQQYNWGYRGGHAAVCVCVVLLGEYLKGALKTKHVGVE